jgi:hypothetical protein
VEKKIEKNFKLQGGGIRFQNDFKNKNQPSWEIKKKTIKKTKIS